MILLQYYGIKKAICCYWNCCKIESLKLKYTAIRKGDDYNNKTLQNEQVEHNRKKRQLSKDDNYVTQ